LRWRVKNRKALQRDIQIPVKASKYLKNLAPRIERHLLLHQNSTSNQVGFRGVFKRGEERQYTEISNLKLIQLIALYRLGRLTKLDFRVFFGLVEMSERRGLSLKALTVDYRLRELLAILRLAPKRIREVRSSIKRLWDNNVIAATQRGVWAMRHVEVGDSGLVVLGDEEFKAEHREVRAAVGHDALLAKTVHFPRRVMRYLAAQRGFGITAAAIMLYLRKMDSRFSRAVLGAKRVKEVFGNSAQTSYRALRKLTRLEVVRKHPFLNGRMRVRNIRGSTWEFNANCLPPECALKRKPRARMNVPKMITLFKEYLSKEKIHLLLPKFLKWKVRNSAPVRLGGLTGLKKDFKVVREGVSSYAFASGICAALGDALGTRRSSLFPERNGVVTRRVPVAEELRGRGKDVATRKLEARRRMLIAQAKALTG
jgi:hypothetical protein